MGTLACAGGFQRGISFVVVDSKVFIRQQHIHHLTINSGISRVNECSHITSRARRDGNTSRCHAAIIHWCCSGCGHGVGCWCRGGHIPIILIILGVIVVHALVCCVCSAPACYE